MVRRLAIAGALCLVLSLVPAAAAAQSGESGRFVTLAARSCPSYADVMANRARNDIQESLEDLGPDSVYRAGNAVDPVTEANNQPACRPIEGWHFTLGTGIRERAVSGPWGSLSIVTGAFATSIVTQASTPLLDLAGRPTGETLAGAVTIELTSRQASLAARSNSLWVQGGTPSDPVLDQLFPGAYGFAAVRCAIDDLNGDNVEWIAYPSGTNHVFCFAYYVQPPPTSGTITIRKEVADVSDASETFSFDGDLSFNPGGEFTLAVVQGRPASQTFYRAAVATPWRVRELVPDGWQLTSLTCEHAGASVVSTDLATATIVLAPGDHVTCTYVDAPRPPDGQLFIRKITYGGTDLFGFRVVPSEGGEPVGHALARTRAEGVPAEADPSPLVLAPGTYRVQERLPRRPDGRWRLLEVRCDGRPLRAADHAEVTIGAGTGAACTFVNRFVPDGSIEVAKRTLGGTGTASFAIVPLRGSGHVSYQSATTRRPDEPVTATGDDTGRLPLGRYLIQELGPSSSTGAWSLDRVVCDGALVPVTGGQATVALTPERPHVRCEFTNRLTARPEPAPVPPGPTDIGGRARPDLALDKHPDRMRAGLGERIVYALRLRNRGPVAAEQVAVVDRLGRGLRLVRADRRCTGARPIVCRLPYLRAGGETTFVVEARVVARRPGPLVNVAVVNGVRVEAIVRNNRDRVVVRGVRLGCLSDDLLPAPAGRARAAC